MEETVFHKIVKGEIPAHVVWESDTHMAFLSIFPNTEGVTVVIPKTYQPSFFAAVEDKELSALVLAAKEVAKLIEKNLEDVGRVALVFEGMGVNYLHAKLFPMHGTADMEEWKESNVPKDTYFETYPGYISTHDCKEGDHAKLAELAKKIRGEK